MVIFCNKNPFSEYVSFKLCHAGANPLPRHSNSPPKPTKVKKCPGLPFPGDIPTPIPFNSERPWLEDWVLLFFVRRAFKNPLQAVCNLHFGLTENANDSQQPHDNHRPVLVGKDFLEELPDSVEPGGRQQVFLLKSRAIYSSFAALQEKKKGLH